MLFILVIRISSIHTCITCFKIIYDWHDMNCQLCDWSWNVQFGLWMVEFWIVSFYRFSPLKVYFASIDFPDMWCVLSRFMNLSYFVWILLPDKDWGIFTFVFPLYLIFPCPIIMILIYFLLLFRLHLVNSPWALTIHRTTRWWHLGEGGGRLDLDADLC